YDLPGYGTSKFPADTYIEKFEVRDYDIFLCVFDGKFTSSDDAMFFAEIRRGERPCLLVRNKLDTLWEPGKTVAQLQDVVREDARKQCSQDAEVLFTSTRTGDGL